ncbi:MAG: secretin N-terminal domain-containing protein [Campylobacterales bacterium]|nr:secretin N-terminal domain-containing protein [Campylobacterales bacterium]
MRRFLALLSLWIGVALPSSACDDMLFSFDLSQSKGSVRIVDIVENVAQSCHFSVIVVDKEARKMLESKLFLVHIKDYTLDHLFDFLFSQNNLFYRYDAERKVLTLSYLETRSFVIDYVNLSEQTTESTKTITVGAASNNNGTNGTGGTSGYGGGTTGGDAMGTNGAMQGGGLNADSTTIRSNTKFEFWEKLTHEIDAILSRDEDARQISSKSIINREAGIVTITGTKSQIERVEQYLEKLRERLHKQVMLETKIFELRYADRNNSGVDWSKFQLSLGGKAGNMIAGDQYGSLNAPSFSFNYQFSMEGLLQFLHRYGDVNTLSTPKILTLNNQPAVINVGNQINYRYQSGSVSATNVGASTTNTYIMSSVFVGLTLNIVPEITDDGFVILRINPVLSEELDADNALSMGSTAQSVNDDGVRTMPPDIKIKQLSSIVKAKDGSRVVIGGLVSTRSVESKTSVPLLGAIPVVGGLFRSSGVESEKVELIIVVTPKIVTHDNFPTIGDAERHITERFE